MKRYMSMFLALVMCISLCACGGQQDNNEKIAEALQKDWKYEAILELPTEPAVMPIQYTFQDGTVVGKMNLGGEDPANDVALIRASGTYEIADKKIILNWTEYTVLLPWPRDLDNELTYSFEKGTLHLFSEDNIELVQG